MNFPVLRLWGWGGEWSRSSPPLNFYNLHLQSSADTNTKNKNRGEGMRRPEEDARGIGRTMSPSSGCPFLPTPPPISFYFYYLYLWSSTDIDNNFKRGGMKGPFLSSAPF